MERSVPDPYLYAVVLTFITVAAARIGTPSNTATILTSWYCSGLWEILALARLGIKDMRGYCVIALLMGLVL